MDKETFNKLLEDFNQLNDKINKLRTFLLDKEDSKALNNLNRDLLIAQLKAMESYISILSIRIGLNTPTDTPKNTEEESK